MLFWIILIAVFLALCYLFYVLFKGVIKALLSASGILFLIMLVLGALVISDARDFAANFQTEPNLFILEEDGKMLAAAKDVSQEGKTNELTDDEFSYYSAMYEKEDYKGMLGGKYRVVIVSMDAFDAVSDSDFGGSGGLKKDFVFMMLRSDSAVDAYVEDAINKLGVKEEQKEPVRKRLMEEMPAEAALRSQLFVILLSTSSKKNSPLFIVEQYKKGNMAVYPETMLFRAIKVIPLQLFESASKIGNQKEA